MIVSKAFKNMRPTADGIAASVLNGFFSLGTMTSPRSLGTSMTFGYVLSDREVLTLEECREFGIGAVHHTSLNVLLNSVRPGHKSSNWRTGGTASLAKVNEGLLLQLDTSGEPLVDATLEAILVKTIYLFIGENAAAMSSGSPCSAVIGIPVEELDGITLADLEQGGLNIKTKPLKLTQILFK